MLKPVWTYGTQLWGTANYTNIEMLQRFQSKILTSLVNSPWFVSNNTVHDDLSIMMVNEEAGKHVENYLERLNNHRNPLPIMLLDDTNEIRKPKRNCILDLPFRT